MISLPWSSAKGIIDYENIFLPKWDRALYCIYIYINYVTRITKCKDSMYL